MSKKVTVTDERLKMEMTVAEMIFGAGNEPSFEGELLVENPSVEEFISLNENFAGAVEMGHVTGEYVEGIVYFDIGANRAFIVDHTEAKIVEVSDQW